MFSIQKNSFLHNYYKDINPRIINRCVEKAWQANSIDEHDLDPPFNRLTSEQPHIPVENVDITRRPLGFGRSAMPKLRRELHHKNEDVVIEAIESICDLVHDSERGYEAINLKIVDRMVDLLAHENEAIREKTSRMLTILARQACGKQAISTNRHLLENVAAGVEDPYPEVRMQVAAMLEMVARFWQAADDLIEFGFVQILLSNLSKEIPEIMVVHLQTLRSLMYALAGKMIAIDADGYVIFTKLLDNESAEIISEALGCLSQLTSTCVGEKLARESKLLNVLNVLIHDERPEIFTNAASVIMFCTVKASGKIAASNIKTMTKRLIQLSRNRLNPSTQIYAIKALTNICEHPEVRKEVQKKYIEYIENIQVGGDPCIRNYKKQLLNVLGWVASSST